MNNIVNKPVIDEPIVTAVRNAIEHRAIWYQLLLEEAKKNGADSEKIGRAAIYQCGCFHGREKLENCADPEDLREFLKVFADETTQKVFEMEIVKCTETCLSIDFHYCPLVAAWMKSGVEENDIPLLCDIAMDGDRGIISQFESYRFGLESTIANGDAVCKIRISKE